MIPPVQAYTESMIGNIASDVASLKHWKMQKAWEALLYAQRNSPYYAARFECGKNIREWQDVPTMTAEDLCDPFALLCVPSRDVARIITLSTTGTQQQKRILFSREDLNATIGFFAHGMSTMVHRGQHAAILMRGKEPDTIGDLLTKGLEHIGVSASVHFPFDDNVATELAHADCIVGLPVPTLRIARKNPFLRPKTVLLSADYVPESVVDGIERLWHCRVLTHYGMTETGYGFAVQCLEKKGYHMRDAEFLCEILNPLTQQQVPHGEYGEVVLTTLSKRAMPLIRYRTGDIARLIPQMCECGAPLYTLDKVTGRMGDDAPLSMPRLDEAVFSVETVYDMRAASRNGKLELTVDCVPGTEQATVQAIQNAIGCDMGLRFASLPMELKKRRIGNL